VNEYRAALVLLERYRSAGGNSGYDASVALALGRGFFELGDIADSRRAWRLGAAPGSAYVPGYSLLENAIDAATRERYREALRNLADGFRLQLRNQQYLSVMSISTRDSSPDRQFSHGIEALHGGDLGSARHWFQSAAEVDQNFAEAHLCLAVLLLAADTRSAGIDELLAATTANDGRWSPDIRNYGSTQGARAARLLIALTER